jgi:hypothetical protein
MEYRLDGVPQVIVLDIRSLRGLSLKGLPDGSHYFVVYATDLFGHNGSSETVHFTVDTVPPNISILSPISKQHFVDDSIDTIPLTYVTTEPISWKGYSLDGQQNVTIAGNMTLGGLSVGQHTLTVYANDTVGNSAASETITFIVAEPEPFPTVPVAVASGASIATIAAGVLVYFKKRKH